MENLEWHNVQRDWLKIIARLSSLSPFQPLLAMQSSSSNRMLKLIWGKANQPTAERSNIKKELFKFKKVTQNGKD
jgi:hypothetical protein